MRNTTLNFKKLRFIPVVFALAVAIGVGAMSLWGSPKTALANDNCGCDVTFTKWLTVFPNMSGTIGGDVDSSSMACRTSAGRSGRLAVKSAVMAWRYTWSVGGHAVHDEAAAVLVRR